MIKYFDNSKWSDIMSSRLNIFCGHYGSGKTEVALNYAIKLSKEGKKVSIVDLDIVNPYFRTADAKKILEENDIELIASEFANSNLDIPTIPPDVKKVFCDTKRTIIFDVGGDDDGAFALGQFNSFFQNEDYKMTLVVNTKRPLTRGYEELYDMAKRIEFASRLSFTDIANNSNIGKLTTSDTLMSDYNQILKLSEKMGIPITLQCGLPHALQKLDENLKSQSFLMQIYIKMPWEL